MSRASERTRNGHSGYSRRTASQRATRAAIYAVEERIESQHRRPTDQQVRQACVRFRIVVAFTAAVMDDDIGTINRGLRAALETDTTFVNRFSSLKQHVARIGGMLDTIAANGATELQRTQLSALTSQLLDTFRTVVGAYETVLARVDLDDGARDAARTVADVAYTALDQDAEERDIVAREAAARALEEAAGQQTDKVTSASLGRFYQEHADREQRTADRLRLVATGLFVLIAALAFWYMAEFVNPTIDGQLVKLTATIPLIVLGGYLVHQSNQHRAAARWSGELAIALHTMPLFTRTLNTAARETLRLALGMRIVLQNEESMVEKADDDGIVGQFTAVLDQIGKLAERGRDIVGRNGGSTDG